MTVGEAIAANRWVESGAGTLEWLAEFLHREGVNLMDLCPQDFERGTPVYVDARADIVEVQRLMARNHIRTLPIVESDRLLGVLDLVEVALLNEIR
jgi:CBS domain